MGRFAWCVLAILVVAGCDRSSNSGHVSLPPRYESGNDVRNALVRSGFGCDDFAPVSRHHRDPGEEDAVETDTCRVDNEEVSISIWHSLGQKQDWTRTRATLGCQFADSLGSSPPVYVDGGRWTVAVKSPALADRISQAIGGAAQSTDCSSAS